VLDREEPWEARGESKEGGRRCRGVVVRKKREEEILGKICLGDLPSLYFAKVFNSLNF
jgi:hypothetical protein